MDLKTPYMRNRANPTVRLIEEPVRSQSSIPQSMPETKQDIQDRAELADELEGMLDAEVEAEEANGVVIANSSGDETDIDMEDLDGAELGADPEAEVEERIQHLPPPSPFKVLPSNAPPLAAYPPLPVSPFQLGQPPQYTYVGRHMIAPVTPAQKMIAQQFLSQARLHLKQSCAGRFLYEEQ